MSLARINTAGQFHQADTKEAQPQVASNGKKKDMTPSSNEFLTMMVAQVQNQNPLNPTDGTQYLTQLGMMSAVSSLEGVKKGMMNMNIGMTNLEMLQSTHLVGKKVLMDVNDGIDINKGQTINGRVQFDKPVDQATVVIYNEKGKEVDKIKLGAQGKGIAEFEIDGDDLGKGTYSFKVVAKSGDKAWEQNIMIAAEVQSVNIPGNGGTVMLSLAGLGKMPMFNMREISA